MTSRQSLQAFLTPIFLIGCLIAPAMAHGQGPSSQAASVPLQATETYRTEELSLQAGKFSVVGDLIIPKKGDKHPVLIIVPGDGPFTRAQGLGQLRMMGVFDFLMAEGYAVFIDDKPGYGASKGVFSQDNLFHERATILSQWIERLRTHPAVDAKGIGVAGQSQAGYVMPLAMAETPGIAFMIALSCPAVDRRTSSTRSASSRRPRSRSWRSSARWILKLIPSRG
ncbi:MAG: hypothetical protein NTY02_05590 [Acidobacteria bacterium]|nr:hypothetical protein [Acidobacteriota bacterium]